MSKAVAQRRQSENIVDAVEDADVFEEETKDVGQKDSKYKRVEIKAVEFDWVFRDKEATNFITFSG